MFRRLFVPVLVAALALVVAPRPSFGFEAGDGRPRADDHRRCMYRCQERGVQKPAPKARLDAPIKPLRHNCPWCGPQHGNPDWGPGFGGGGRWIGPIWIFVPRHRPWGGGFHHPDWYDNGDDHWYHRPRRWHRWHRHRWHDRSRSGGYNHHREHPRGRDF